MLKLASFYHEATRGSGWYALRRCGVELSVLLVTVVSEQAGMSVGDSFSELEELEVLY